MFKGVLEGACVDALEGVFGVWVGSGGGGSVVPAGGGGEALEKSTASLTIAAIRFLADSMNGNSGSGGGGGGGGGGGFRLGG